jgi:hypothetical protein
MSSLANSSLREAGKVYLLYIAAGVAAVPAGVAYSLLVVSGWERWWTVLPLLGTGFAMALLLWRLLERRLFPRQTIFVRQAPGLASSEAQEVPSFWPPQPVSPSRQRLLQQVYFTFPSREPAFTRASQRFLQSPSFGLHFQTHLSGQVGPQSLGELYKSLVAEQQRNFSNEVRLAIAQSRFSPDIWRKPFGLESVQFQRNAAGSCSQERR